CRRHARSRRRRTAAAGPSRCPSSRAMSRRRSTAGTSSPRAASELQSELAQERPGRVSQFAQLDVAEGNGIAVILQADVAAFGTTVWRPLGELAVANACLPIVAPEFVACRLHTVQPVLIVIVPNHDARGVPLARWLHRVFGCRVQTVCCSGLRKHRFAPRYTAKVQD